MSSRVKVFERSLAATGSAGVASSNGALSLHCDLELACPLARDPRARLFAERANDAIGDGVLQEDGRRLQHGDGAASLLQDRF
jgi:hypothetical protein